MSALDKIELIERTNDLGKLSTVEIVQKGYILVTSLYRQGKETEARELRSILQALFDRSIGQ